MAYRHAPAEALAENEFSVMTFNLGRYGHHDRTGDGQAVDLKPLVERDAVAAILLHARPHILAVQEIGGPDVFNQFKERLALSGLPYPFVSLLQRDHSEMNLAVLSQYPIIAVTHHLEDRFSVGEQTMPVERGFLEVDIQVRPDYQFRLLVAQLKSKTYHPLGQTEIRRSEARLLNNHVRRTLGTQPSVNLLVAGDLNDHVHAAPLRILAGHSETTLTDLRPADAYGEVWTAYEEETESYHRYDYLLASPSMRDHFVPAKSRVWRHPLNQASGARRPVLAVFRISNSGTADAPKLREEP